MRITVGILEQQGKHTSPVYPTTDLISRWSFDDDNGDDTSGNAYTLTDASGTSTYSAGKVNNALDLDGSTYMHNESYYDGFTNEMTMAFWYKCNSQTHDGAIIVDAQLLPEYYIYLQANDKFYLSFTRDLTALETVDAIVDDTWHFVVAIYDNGDYYLYQDNVLEDSLSNTPDTFSAATAISVGSYTGDVAVYAFEGSLDNIYIYDIAIDSSTRDSLWNNGNGI